MPHIVLTSILVFRSLSIPLTEKSSVKSIAVKGIDKLLNTRMRIRRTRYSVESPQNPDGRPECESPDRIRMYVRIRRVRNSKSGQNPDSDPNVGNPTYVRIRMAVWNSVESPYRIRTYVRIRCTFVFSVRRYPTYVRIRTAVRNSVESPDRIRTYFRIRRTFVFNVRRYPKYVRIRSDTKYERM